MDDSIGFLVYIFGRVIPYLLRESAVALWELGPAKLFLGMMILLGIIKGLEIAFWLLRRLWLPTTALLVIGGVALAMHS